MCRKSTNKGLWHHETNLPQIFIHQQQAKICEKFSCSCFKSSLGQTYHFSSATLADCHQFINEVNLDDYIENNSKIGDTGRIEVD
ncbi:hypothetical protein NPIL_652511 [Nephila pilipes]|uniref:Uncharacterized protein n=1 Tax=Nephila pilipes TaxID=299642 RepID=A0A8X6PPL3_NEPPI|nr:hypothetical protein NPIL_652511 [Nephila pilipes]